MLIKMSQRSGAKALAQHLLNTQDNEHVTELELRGFSADNLTDALNEIHVLRLANKKIKSELVSMSINPPIGKTVTSEELVKAANRAEDALGLSSQPRAIIQHTKANRSHIHVVWSRIDENLKAIKLPFYKTKLQALSRQLYLEKGWDLPKGLQNKHERTQTNYDLAETHIARRQKQDPKVIKARVQSIWAESHDSEAFQSALKTHNFVLAKGDKRGFVLVDIHGDVRALTRTLSLKAKDVQAKLGDNEHLPSVDEAKQSFAPEHKAEYQRRHTELIQRQAYQLQPHHERIARLVETQKAQRDALNQKHAQRQQIERNARQSQYQKGLSLKALFNFVLGRTHKLRKQHEAEYQASLIRDQQEMDNLLAKQQRERAPLQAPIDALRAQHSQEHQHFNTHFTQQLQRAGLSQAFTKDIMQEFTL